MRKKTRNGFTLFLVAAWLVACPSAFSAEQVKKWQGTTPRVALDPEDWKNLLSSMMDSQMPYGAMATANRIITLFPEVQTKEAAYRAMVRLIDLGFPGHSRSLFATADIEPTEPYDFVNSYYLYKGMANLETGTKRWADFYFEKVDKENFPKYLFFSALKSYKDRELDTAEATLRKILSKQGQTLPISFISKVARTLARIYFERTQFDKALDVYQNFLLKLNPMTPSDWLESGWTLYHLKRYEEALGYVHNLQAGSSVPYSTLERFVLRALIYRELCATEQIQWLKRSFEQEYGETINGIKNGQPLASFTVLKTLNLKLTEKYRQMNTARQLLKEEQKGINKLGSTLNELATHLYQTEIENLGNELKLYEEEALQRAAAEMVTLDENIKFLAFDVVREIYNPDSVFKKGSQAQAKGGLLEALENNRFLLRWTQQGDYWRDERLNYRAVIENQCAKDSVK